MVETERNAWLAAALSCLVLAACSHSREEQKPDAPGEAPGVMSIRQERHPNEKVVEFDLNHDGKPDVWEYTMTAGGPDGKPQERLVRKELDANFDGKVDIVKLYDEKEQLSRELMDFDYDGKVDQVNEYEKGQLVRKVRMLQSTGRPDEWVYFEKGQIVRKEKDTHCDNRVDYWEYWENGQVDRVGEDIDCDGKVDRWTKNPNNG